MLRKYLREDRHIFQMLFDGVIIGFISGGFSILYRYLISMMNHYRELFYSSKEISTTVFLVVSLIVVIFILDGLLKWAPLSGGSGIPQIHGEVMGVFKMEAFPTFVSKIIGGSLGNFAGFSLGREGPSIQIGGALAKFLAKILKRDNDHTKFMITAGASAGLAAAFNAPIAGTVFAMEEIHKSFSRFVWIPCIIASVIANYLSFQILGHNMAFSFSVTQNLPMRLISLAFVIGLLTGVVGVIFNRGIVRAQSFYQGISLPRWIKLGALIALTFFVGKFFYSLTGGGHDLLENFAFHQQPI
ncbi:MAG: chloride channel protein, partial [Tissierellia bacterium]|nr:chloride channel protein [Tissierellia bacterium]